MCICFYRCPYAPNSFAALALLAQFGHIFVYAFPLMSLASNSLWQILQKTVTSSWFATKDSYLITSWPESTPRKTGFVFEGATLVSFSISFVFFIFLFKIISITLTIGCEYFMTWLPLQTRHYVIDSIDWWQQLKHLNDLPIRSFDDEGLFLLVWLDWEELLYFSGKLMLTRY